MTIDVLLPELGENIKSGDVVRVLVKPGDKVQVDQSLIELETDKASFEVPSTAEGIVKDVLVKEGDVAQIGQPIVRLEESGNGQTAGAAPTAVAIPTAATSAAGQPVSAAGEDRSVAPSGKGAGSTAPKGTKAGGTRDAKVPRPEPETASVYATGAVPRIAPGHAMTDEPFPAGIAPPSIEELALRLPELASPTFPPAAAAPSVRRFAREIGIDIDAVKGSGPSGRISMQDVKDHAKSLLAVAVSTHGAAGRPLPDFAKWGPVERVAMTNVRRKTAENMEHAWTAVPSVTQHDDADITDLESLRKAHAHKAEALDGKLTMTAILLKVCSAALKKYPQFNASVDMPAGEIVYKRYHHLGVAVDTDRGLLVPVLRDVDTKNILQLSVELAALAGKARGKRLTPDDMSGGTFTITNLGGIGGTSFTPIVNAPEAAILGVSRASMRPTYIEGALVPRLVLPLSLTYDHRLIDGADAARFLRWICEALEHPFLLPLEG